MAERRKYRNDPIEEALCEIRFERGNEWDLTLPGRFYELIKDTYDGKPRQQNVMEAGFQTVAQTEGPALEVKGSFAKVQFPTQDGRRLLAIGPDVLSTHVLSPYPYWEDFHRRIEEAYQSYLKLVEPVAVRTISIRYINRVLIEASTDIDLDEYFGIAPQPPSDTPLTMFGFLSRTESMYQDKPVRLATTLASVEAEEGKAG